MKDEATLSTHSKFPFCGKCLFLDNIIVVICFAVFFPLCSHHCLCQFQIQIFSSSIDFGGVKYLTTLHNNECNHLNRCCMACSTNIILCDVSLKYLTFITHRIVTTFFSHVTICMIKCSRPINICFASNSVNKTHNS